MSVKTGFICRLGSGVGHLGSYGSRRALKGSTGLKRAQIKQTTFEYSSGVDIHKHTHMFVKGHIGPYCAILGHFAIWAILRVMAHDGS